MFETKDLAIKKTVPEMVAAYNSAKDKIEQAYQLLEDAKIQLDTAFGKEKYYSGFTTVSRNHASDKAEENIKYIMTDIKKSAWQNIINLLGIKKLLSIKRADEFDKKMQDGKDLPEITDATIYDMLESLREQSKDYAMEAVKEVFDYLRPGKNESNKLKTNKKNGRFELGEKIILSGVVSHGWYGKGKHEVSYYRRNELTAIDRVFALLDGKPIDNNSYQSPLIDAINTSESGCGETAYFKFSAHKNGNLHLTFKRLDLVTKMNQLAGNPTELRGKTSKEARKWADPSVLLHVFYLENIELQNILYHREFWPDVNKTYHSFLVCGFEKESKNSKLLFVTGKVTKEGSIYDVFVTNEVKESYTIWKSDIEKYWDIEVSNFLVG